MRESEREREKKKKKLYFPSGFINLQIAFHESRVSNISKNNKTKNTVKIITYVFNVTMF